MFEKQRSDAAIRAMIIDDEKPARELIDALLADFEDIDVVGECADGRQAVEAIESTRPDLVFLDIRMPHLDGFGVLERLNDDSPPVVIFVTAYDQYAVRAFEVNALDYLLKPIRRNRFAEAIERARRKLDHPAKNRGESLRGLLQHWNRDGGSEGRLTQSEYLQRIFVRERRRSISIEADNIDWIGSLDHFVEIHTQGRSYVLHEKLSALDKKLDPRDFFRIHRTRIVNLSAISEFNIDERGNYVTILRDNTSHRVARSRCRELERLLSSD